MAQQVVVTLSDEELIDILNERLGDNLIPKIKQHLGIPEDEQRCSGFNIDGRQCRNKKQSGQDVCSHHGKPTEWLGTGYCPALVKRTGKPCNNKCLGKMGCNLAGHCPK
jgi:hypothetical protein